MSLSTSRSSSLRTRIVAAGVGGVLLTAVALATVGTVSSARFGDQAADAVQHQSRDHAAETSADMTSLVATVSERLQAQVAQSMSTAQAVLAESGGFSQDASRSVRWTAVDQFTKKETAVSLPRATVGGRWLGQNSDPKVATPVVDRTRSLAGGTVTIFQRMNAAGDMLRVATNVPNAAGKRAIGTYLPAKGADGTPNAVVASMLAKKPFRGVALVVDAWYLTAYDPILDARGEVVGILYVGIPQAEATKALVEAVTASHVGDHGYVALVSAAAADRGRVLASGGPLKAGEVALEAKDGTGAAYVGGLLDAAAKAGPGTSVTKTLTLAGTGGATPAATQVWATYDPAYKWVVLVHAYTPDWAAAATVLDAGRRAMVLWFVVAALVAALVVGAGIAFWANRLGRRLAALRTAADAFAAGDLTVAVDDRGTDEVAAVAASLTHAGGQLRAALGDVSEAAARLESDADGVLRVSEQLADASEAAARESQTAAGAADEVSRTVLAVAGGSKEIGASIAEISSNAQEAARVSEDTVLTADRAAEAIEQLDASSEQIVEVIKVISSIAEQTNLLALNATIEAARAGEAGRGFAVVAGEVKELAQETARATDDVTQKVGAINTDTRRATEAVRAIRDAISRVNSYQAAIAAAVEEQTATTSEVSHSVDRAAAETDQIARGLAVVTERVTDTGEAVRQAREVAEGLRVTSGRLGELVRGFRV